MNSYYKYIFEELESTGSEKFKEEILKDISSYRLMGLDEKNNSYFVRQFCFSMADFLEMELGKYKV